VRSEALREGGQDAEVRVFLEKATEIPKYRQKLGEDLAGKVRKMLDERILGVNEWGVVMPYSRLDKKKLTKEDRRNRMGRPPSIPVDALGSSAKLYAAAEEVAAKLGVTCIDASEGIVAPVLVQRRKGKGRPQRKTR
jgi:hypothetical protein